MNIVIWAEELREPNAHHIIQPELMPTKIQSVTTLSSEVGVWEEKENNLIENTKVIKPKSFLRKTTPIGQHHHVY